jgi:hypothetical protein
MTMTKFAVSNVCSAFTPSPVGTKVTDAGAFTAALALAVEAHDTAGDRTPGQHFVTLPGDALATVSAGVARRADVPEDGYVVRVHRGRAECFAARRWRAPTAGLAAVVYTRAAYAADPQVTAAEAASIPGDATHVIVAVLAFAGPRAPLSPHRFVANLAGGNKDAATYTADEMRAMAREIIAYDDEWIVVAG